MAANSKIEWTDSTFNPWIGCTKISPACDHCYAEAQMDTRMSRVKWGAGQPRSRTSESYWKQPLRWNARPFVECMACGWRGEKRECNVADGHPGFHPPVASCALCPNCMEPTMKASRRRVFCASLADVFDNEAPPAWRAELLALISGTPNLDWLLLTKRIGNVAKMIEAPGMQKCGLPPNVWLGSTICNQAEAERDIPKLLAVPAARHFLSIEPMLSGLDVRPWLPGPCQHPACHEGSIPVAGSGRPCPWCQCGPSKRLDWIIAGGESGPHARPSHPDWFRSLRDQCAAAGVPFLMKQWGEYVEWTGAESPSPSWRFPHPDNTPMVRVGKKAAGRLLDGVEHNGVPA